MYVSIVLPLAPSYEYTSISLTFFLNILTEKQKQKQEKPLANQITNRIFFIIIFNLFGKFNINYYFTNPNTHI